MGNYIFTYRCIYIQFVNAFAKEGRQRERDKKERNGGRAECVRRILFLRSVVLIHFNMIWYGILGKYVI